MSGGFRGRAPRLLAITPGTVSTAGDHPAARDDVVSLARQAVRAGADAIQVREPGLEDGALLDLVTRVVAAVSDVQGPSGVDIGVLVNDRVDVALAAGAQGVHVRSDGLEPGDVRRAWRAGGGAGEPWVGASTHSGDELARALERGADYATLGPWGETPGKSTLGPARFAAELARARDLSGGEALRWVALGGVEPQDVAALSLLARPADSWGVAAIRPFVDDAAGAAARFGLARTEASPPTG